jgi:hypothetical protein
MLPLWAIAMAPFEMEAVIGWAFTSVGEPVVEYLIWPIEQYP